MRSELGGPFYKHFTATRFLRQGRTGARRYDVIAPQEAHHHKDPFVDELTPTTGYFLATLRVAPG